MATLASPVRRRLSPEARRSLILDHAAELVAREGLAQLSVDRVGRAAGISKSLVYAYFPNLTDLLRELYKREMRHLRRAQRDAAADATTFEELVRSITHVYLHYIAERGLIIERLQSEPSLSEMHDPTDFGREAAVDYLTEIVTAHFDLPPDVARAATDISFGLPASAGGYLQRHGMDLALLEDLTVTMIIGSVMHVKNEFMARRQPLNRG
jgi:TetR/AcrR family transcriptional regulator, fatty acid biosynthesis regulator